MSRSSDQNESATRILNFEYKTLSQSPVVLVEWDNLPGWPLKAISDNLQAVLPLTAEQVSGTLLFADYVHPEDLIRLGEEVQQHLQQKKRQWQQYYRLQDGAGGYRWIHDHTCADYHADGTLKTLEGFLYDQTELVLSLQNEKLSKQHLSRLEERWRSVLEASNLGVWDWDARTDQVYFSPLWKAMLGYQPDEVSNTLTEWNSRLHPDDRDRVYQDLNRHLEGHTDRYENVHRVQHKAGHWLWILDRGQVFSRDEQGKPLRVVGTHSDVTEQYDAGNHLNRLAENLPGVLYQYLQRADGSSAFPFATKGLSDVYEVTPEQVRQDASAVFERIHPDDLESVAASIQHSAEHLTEWQMEYRVCLPQKGLRWLKGQAKPDADGQGNVLWHGYINDITEEKNRLATLNRMQEQYRLAMEATQIGIWHWDMPARQIRWTDEAYTLLGYPPQAFNLDLTAFQNMVHPDDWAGFLPEVFRQIEQDGTFQVQFRLKNAFDDWLWIEGRGRITRWDDTGSPAEMMGTHTDITRSKQAESTLLSAIETAESATRAKSELLSMVSHEIRTPLGGIIGLSEQILQQAVLDDLAPTLKKIHRSANQLLHILNDTLDYSKIESGRMQTRNSRYDLNAMLQELINLFEPVAEKKAIGLQAELPCSGPLFVVSDELRLRQVLTNLLSNAIKFTERGSVRLQVEPVQQSEQQLVLSFAVQDTGIGIREDIQPRLFRAFEQGSSDIQSKYGGTGLGLMISQRLVKMLGCEPGIQLHSQPGHGSRFSFTLTLNLQSGADSPADQPVAELAPAGFTGRVLVADDIDINRDVIRHQLQQLGLEVTDVADGQAALDCIKREPTGFDLVLMDLNMPVMDGFSAASAIRPLQPDLPVIALTASALEDDRHRVLNAGMSGYLTKPVSPDGLIRELARWLTPQAPALQTERNAEAEAEEIAQRQTAPEANRDSRPTEAPEHWVDFYAGLELFGGNRPAYQQLMETFVSDLDSRYRDLGLQLQQLPEASAGETLLALHRVSHALKGAAGNLKAFALAEQATVLDNKLRRGLLPSKTEISDYCHRLNSTVQAIEQYLQQSRAEPSGNSGLSGQQSAVTAQGLSGHQEVSGQGGTSDAGLFSGLLQAVQANEFVEDALLQQVRQQIPPAQLPHWQQFEQALDQLDFGQAEATLVTLMQGLGIAPACYFSE